MSELAYDTEGDRFEVPAHVTGWRVRRFRNVGARGAPEVVFGDDGRPLVVPVDANVDEFRAAVGGVPGRYRLDPLEASGKTADKVPVAYLQFSDPARPTAGSAVAAPTSDSMLAEIVRANAEMVKVIAERFSGVMDAAASLLRAADGAGLPARTPAALRNAGIELEGDEDDEDDEDNDDREPGIGDFLTQVMPLVQMVLAKQSSKHAPARNTQATQSAPTSPPEPTKAPKHDGPITPAMLAHFQAVQAQLTPEEAEFARAVAAELSPAEIQQWMTELSAMSVDDAVATIRKHIAGQGGAS
jgi:hypothetical protein